MADKIRVIVAGALGRMGRETVKAILQDEELLLTAAVDTKARGETVSDITGFKGLSMNIGNDIELAIEETQPQVLVDFTNPQAVFNNVRCALVRGVTCVVGTTGLNEMELSQLERLAQEKEVGVAVVPNFAIGAVLMMKFAQEAAQYFPDVEIIELHHDKKVDAPSGTAIKTAELINQTRSQRAPRNIREMEKIAGCRGGNLDEIRIHSVRLPGFVAHQEVIFGSLGQSLTIRHDSYDRVSFMPGVIMAIKRMVNKKGMIYGMEKLL